MNVLVLCTGNSARSILLESILQHCSNGRIHAFSAGSKPVGKVNPGAISQLKSVGLPTDGYRSKNWDEFGTPNTVKMDVVITVCGNARDETCPIWPGSPVSAHWGVEDPADVTEPPEAVQRAFSNAYEQSRKRANMLIDLPFEKMSATEISTALKNIGDSV